MVLEHRSLSEQVADLLRDRIVQGELAPGTRLVERTIGDDLGVSRVPVREAIKQLTGEGFLTQVPRTGVIVAEISWKKVEELFEIREALEVLSIRLATQRATQEQQEEMRSLLVDASRALQEHDTAGFDRANERLHDIMLAAANNDMLASVMLPLNSQLHWLLRQYNEPDVLHEQHVALVEAITSGNKRLAERAARSHIRTSRELALEHLRPQQTNSQSRSPRRDESKPRQLQEP
jgi:DNA-binding GntR family transcriptional regulator